MARVSVPEQFSLSEDPYLYLWENLVDLSRPALHRILLPHRPGSGILRPPGSHDVCWYGFPRLCKRRWGQRRCQLLELGTPCLYKRCYITATPNLRIFKPNLRNLLLSVEANKSVFYHLFVTRPGDVKSQRKLSKTCSQFKFGWIQSLEAILKWVSISEL